MIFCLPESHGSDCCAIQHILPLGQVPDHPVGRREQLALRQSQQSTKGRGRGRGNQNVPGRGRGRGRGGRSSGRGEGHEAHEDQEDDAWQWTADEVAEWCEWRGLPIPGTLHYQDLDWDEQEDEPQQVSAGSKPCRKMAAKATAAAKKAAKAKKKAKAAAKKKKKEQAKKKKACDDDEDEQPKKRKPAANVDGSAASFARRNQPQREFPAKKWQAIKDSFMKHVRPLVSSAPGLHEAGCSQDGLYSRVCFHAGLYLIYRKPYKNPTNDNLTHLPLKVPFWNFCMLQLKEAGIDDLDKIANREGKNYVRTQLKART